MATPTIIDQDTVLEAMGERWWPTGLIARSLLPDGGHGIPWRKRSLHHDVVVGILRELEGEGLVRRRRVAEDGRVLSRDEAGRGHTEWQRVA